MSTVVISPKTRAFILESNKPVYADRKGMDVHMREKPLAGKYDTCQGGLDGRPLRVLENSVSCRAVRTAFIDALTQKLPPYTEREARSMAYKGVNVWTEYGSHAGQVSDLQGRAGPVNICGFTDETDNKVYVELAAPGYPRCSALKSFMQYVRTVN